MPITPFRLDLELRSPLAGGELPTLDAVLLGELARLNPDAPDYARKTQSSSHPSHPSRPALQILGWDGKQNNNAILKFTNGIPHASALMFDARGGQSRAAKITGRQRELREIAPLGLYVKKTRGVFLARGKYKNDDPNHFACRSVESAHFWGVGDPVQIRRILSFWQGVGAQWRNGWGELIGGEKIGWWLDDELTDLPPNAEKWWGLLDENGAPVRPLPVALFRELGGDDKFPVRYRRVAPPYWLPSAPRVAAVAPDERGGFPLSPPPRPSAEKTETPAMDPMKFLLEQFARRMRPADDLLKDEEKGGIRAALQETIKSQSYQHRQHLEGKKSPRLGGSLFIAVGASAKLFSNAMPDEKARADGFQSAGPLVRESAEWQKTVYQAAMTETDGLCVVIQFPRQRVLAPEDLNVFSGRSDNAAISGDDKYSGWFSRAVIRRIEEIAERAGLTLSKLASIRDVEIVRRNPSDANSIKWVNRERKQRKIGEDDFPDPFPDPRELADDWMDAEREKMKLSEDEMFDLRDWLADMSKAGWKVLAAAPCFRKKEAGE